MAKSNVKFQRWVSIRDSSWPYQVFKKHTQELNRMMWTNDSAAKYVYRNLKKEGAIWSDKSSKYFEFPVHDGREAFSDLKDWSNYYNQFQNWVNLNGIMALSSNFEVYLSAIVSLAIESDPGILYNSPKSIDGVLLLKKGAMKFPFEQEILTSFTKGDWNSRKNAFNNTFSYIPKTIEENIGEFEKLRILRNKVGHAFGRDINKARNTEVKNILPMEKLNAKKFINIRQLIWQSVTEIDEYLLKHHIGEYQVIRFYHKISPSLKGTQGNKAAVFKKKIGAFGDLSGKIFCQGLVKYYDAL